MDITTQEIIGQYSLTVAALGALAVLLIVQLIVADAIGIRNKHVPGAAVPSDHNNLLFRATRTVANTNESFSIFVVALLFALLSLASPTAVGYATWAYVLTRALYAVCYYANLQILRSIVFAFSLLSIVSLIVVGFRA